MLSAVATAPGSVKQRQAKAYRTPNVFAVECAPSYNIHSQNNRSRDLSKNETCQQFFCRVSDMLQLVGESRRGLHRTKRQAKAYRTRINPDVTEDYFPL
jgi:hypothetical protein